MKEKTRKIIQWVLLALGVIGGVMAVLHATGSDSKHVLAAGTMQELDNNFSGMYDLAYFLLIGFIAITLIAIVFFVVKSFIENFKTDSKKALGSLLGIGLLVVVVVVSYFLAKGDDVSAVLLQKNNLTATGSKMVGAACIMVYIIFIASCAAIIFAEVAGAIKKRK